MMHGMSYLKAKHSLSTLIHLLIAFFASCSLSCMAEELRSTEVSPHPPFDVGYRVLDFTYLNQETKPRYIQIRSRRSRQDAPGGRSRAGPLSSKVTQYVEYSFCISNALRKGRCARAHIFRVWGTVFFSLDICGKMLLYHP